MRRHARRLALGVIGGSAALIAAFVVHPAIDAAGAPDQQPSFRSAVDLIAVDVQVVDRDGTPMTALTPAQFEVTISGKRRKVVSADFVRSTNVDGTPFRESVVGPQAFNQPLVIGDPRVTRVYILAFDVGSLTLSDSRAMVGSALTFIDRLLPTDLLGLYTFPVGSRVEPTTDHSLVRRRVLNVVGSAQTFSTHFNLSPAEVVDINAEASRLATLSVGRGGQVTLAGEESETIRSVQGRECGATDTRCVGEIINEAQSLGFYLEGRATEGLNGIRSLVNILGEYPGRKTVVMFSSGIPSSDRPGGRPDLGDLPKALGQDAAATNTAIYTIHVDTGHVRAMSAETRRIVSTPANRNRDDIVGGRVLDEFSDASGGALMRVVTGSGEYALERVLRETSSHYLLGVEPEDADRDGRLRELRVKVNTSNATVRSRLWVRVPKRSPS